MKLLLIDNFDSFTYNLVQLIEECGVRDILVRNNIEVLKEEVEQSDKILISPGPGLPSEAGKLKEIIQYFYPSKSILGICLGHQAIAEVFGGQLSSFEFPFHGYTTQVTSVKPQDALFNNLPDTFDAGLYHSWYVEENTLPECLRITAISKENVIMGIAHREFDVKGLQFHPESIMTPLGQKIIKNWLEKDFR